MGLKGTLIDLSYMNINGWDIESENGVFCIHCVLFNSSEHAFVIDPINDKGKFGFSSKTTLGNLYTAVILKNAGQLGPRTTRTETSRPTSEA